MSSDDYNLRHQLNFSWLVDGEIAGSRGPTSYKHLEFIKDQGVRALVRLTDLPRIVPVEIERLGMADCHEPVPDMLPPSMSQIENIFKFIQDCLRDGKPVGVSCDGGFGRTGTLMSCYLVAKGYSVEDAIRELKAKRPGSALTPEQENAVIDYASQLGR